MNMCGPDSGGEKSISGDGTACAKTKAHSSKKELNMTDKRRDWHDMQLGIEWRGGVGIMQGLVSCVNFNLYSNQSIICGCCLSFSS